MNQYVTGGVIKELREKNKTTQAIHHAISTAPQSLTAVGLSTVTLKTQTHTIWVYLVAEIMGMMQCPTFRSPLMV